MASTQIVVVTVPNSIPAIQLSGIILTFDTQDKLAEFLKTDTTVCGLQTKTMSRDLTSLIKIAVMRSKLAQLVLKL